jgi:hypothetical protein
MVAQGTRRSRRAGHREARCDLGKARGDLGKVRQRDRRERANLGDFDQVFLPKFELKCSEQ